MTTVRAAAKLERLFEHAPGAPQQPPRYGISMARAEPKPQRLLNRAPAAAQQPPRYWISMARAEPKPQRGKKYIYNKNKINK